MKLQMFFILVEAAQGEGWETITVNFSSYGGPCYVLAGNRGKCVGAIGWLGTLVKSDSSGLEWSGWGGMDPFIKGDTREMSVCCVKKESGHLQARKWLFTRHWIS